MPQTNPTSPVRLKKTVFSWVSCQKFPLHFLLDYFRGQFEAKFFQQDLLVVSGFRDTAGADLHTAASRQHDVHRADVGQFRKHSARFASETGLVSQLRQSFPQHVCHEADEDMSKDTLFFRMPDRANRQIAFVNSERGFCFC